MITAIKRNAVHDGDGIRTTVFFKGCPLKCIWCHNPEGICREPQMAKLDHLCMGCGTCRGQRTPEAAANCPTGALVCYGKEQTVEELLPILLQDKPFYDCSGGGVTLSGGECLAQPEFAAALAKALTEKGVRVNIDTCGFVSRSALDGVIPYTDTFLYDVKAIDEAVHIRCTGQSNQVILENLRYLNDLGKTIEVRFPYVPGYNDDQVDKIAEFLRPLKNIKATKVLPYHNYAGSKYDALDMDNTLPKELPTEEALGIAEQKLSFIG